MRLSTMSASSMSSSSRTQVSLFPAIELQRILFETLKCEMNLPTIVALSNRILRQDLKHNFLSYLLCSFIFTLFSLRVTF